jgi:hypothetical protein
MFIIFLSQTIANEAIFTFCCLNGTSYIIFYFVFVCVYLFCFLVSWRLFRNGILIYGVST